ncbi:MAG: hypothetical protein E4G94_11570, partial [ANME-2 cluster archaeon]
MPKVPNGTILNNKYRIDAFLKEGGMGQVYKGTDIATNKDIVIKFVKYHHDGQDPIREDKLKVEANVLKKLIHVPNIVKYIADGTDSNHGFFLVIDFIRGETLKDNYLGKICPDKDLHKICNVLLSTLEYLHGQNIIYRDLSPDNIMASASGDFVLIDFGAVKEGFSGLSQSVATGIGKADYGPPEQLQGYPTYQSDIFSVGATMWFLVTGLPPRMRDTSGRILSAKLSNRGVSDHIDSIILKATEPDVAKRYQNTDEMMKALIGSSIQKTQYPRFILANKIYSLIDDLYIIGRENNISNPGIQINDPNKFISTRQARAYKMNGKWFIENLASKSEHNKTYIN